jgi:predicted nucleic acid-binding protein
MAAELIYWDSDAFLGYLQNEPGKAAQCEGTLERARKGEVVIVTSSLTLAEVLWMKGAPRTTKQKAELVRQFFRKSYIRVVNVTRKIAEEAQELVWDHSIKPKDAIHVATAKAYGTPILETFDEKLIKKSESVGTPPIIIREPQAPLQGKLL